MPTWSIQADTYSPRVGRRIGRNGGREDSVKLIRLALNARNRVYLFKKFQIFHQRHAAESLIVKRDQCYGHLQCTFVRTFMHILSLFIHYLHQD